MTADKEVTKMSDAQYLDALASMFGGPDESVIECRSEKIVTVRKQQMCMCPAHKPLHLIEIGQRAACERAIVDGTWGASYVCLPCLESWQAHITDPDKKYCTVARGEHHV